MVELIKAMGLGATEYPIEIAELHSVRKTLDEVLTEDEKRQLIDALAFHPEGGDVIPGTLNRLRKLRWRYGTKGKRGGLRVIYFFYDLNMPLYILAIYKKNEKANITKTEEREMLKLTEALLAEHAKKRNLDHARGQTA